MYSFIRLDDGSRLVIPNATLASNTIRNATIVSPEKVAEVTVQVPLSEELRPDPGVARARARERRRVRAVPRRERHGRGAAARALRGRGRAPRARAPPARARDACAPQGSSHEPAAQRGDALEPSHRRRRRARRRARVRAPQEVPLVGRRPDRCSPSGSRGDGARRCGSVGSNCDLSSLRPVSIGENSFVYAADNSLLGTIPAERNRQPVALKEMSPWLVEGDDRDRGPALLRSTAASTSRASRAR